MAPAAQKSRKTPEGRPWRKGQSGNPGGRPKGVATRARELIGNDPKQLLGVFLEIAQDPSEKSGDRIAAAKEFLARAYGQAPAYSPVEGGDPLDLSDVDRAIEDGAAEVVELARLREASDPREAESGGMAATG